jgi:hypothetical protein
MRVAKYKEGIKIIDIFNAFLCRNPGAAELNPAHTVFSVAHFS